MNILFLTMSRFSDVEASGIYTDLMRRFRDEGNAVYIMSPLERKFRKSNSGNQPGIRQADGVTIVQVPTLNLQKTNIIEKGIGQVLVEPQFRAAVKRYLHGVNFDLILYTTPPITFPQVIKYAKKASPQAKTYLMLKDIFPQNAVDLGMMSKSGVKGILYKFFRRKEKKLYALSDYIGCMSPANVKYVLDHNPEISPSKVEICPNSVDKRRLDSSTSAVNRGQVLAKYGLPTDIPIFIYGGNLGKPQGIPFLLQCMEAVKDRKDCHFVIIGTGTELPKLMDWKSKAGECAVSVMKGLPKADYDALAEACNVGLIFLDYRFTIPNYPSRLLAYLQGCKPVIVCTDPNCDTGSIAEANGYGYYCPSNSVESFVDTVDRMLASNLELMGENGYRFLLENYTVDNTYNAIVRHLI